MVVHNIVFIHVYLKTNFKKLAVVTLNHNPMSMPTALLPPAGSSEIPSGSRSWPENRGKSLQILFFLYSSVFSNLSAFFMLSTTNGEKKVTRVKTWPEIILIDIVNPQTSVFYWLFNGVLLYHRVKCWKSYCNFFLKLCKMAFTAIQFSFNIYSMPFL